MNFFSHFIQTAYTPIAAQLHGNDCSEITRLRQKGMDFLHQQQFLDLEKKYQHLFHTEIQNCTTPYQIQLQPATYRPVEEYFHCKVQNIDTQMFVFLNGWYVHNNAPLTITDNGIITGSLLAALAQFPQIVLPHLTNSTCAHSLDALNQLLFNDGLFIYVPENVVVDKPMQLISLTETQENLLIHNRNLIILERNASLKFVQCDDSLHQQKNFINNHTQVVLNENAHFSYYKMENKDAQSVLYNKVHVIQKGHSHFYSNAITFNAGLLQNDIHVELTEPFAHSQLYGLYLVDRKQNIGNQILVDHQVPDCESYQLYKGIVDDEASAHFNGHVIVRPDAQRTIASQTNRNITLTDEAQVKSQPFLEIYADNVKCNHGTTVGQLDSEAMFYLRSRGICERNARMLLMFAFANEIADKIEIESLQNRYKEMIQKRLNGELTICDRCVLHCSAHEWNFNIENK